MATMKQIAELAEVSAATVSHVINETRPVSDDVRARVWQAIDELGYVPNAVARSLRTSGTRTLGMMLPNSSNPFFAEVMRGVEDECFRQGYSLIVCNSDDSPRKQSTYLRVLMQKRVDGLVVVSAGSDADLRELLSNTWIPLVIVDREVEGVSADLVEVNHELGGYLAGRHLVELGHRRLACIAGSASLGVNVQRVAGFSRALEEAGLHLDPASIVHTDFTSSGGYGVMRQLLALPERPTGVFADNDLLALGAICAAQEAGLSLPRDLSVVGFDDIAIAAYTSPKLTTVRQPKQRIGELTAQLVIERIEGRRSEICREILQPDLCIRQTTSAWQGTA